MGPDVFSAVFRRLVIESSVMHNPRPAGSLTAASDAGAARKLWRAPLPQTAHQGLSRAPLVRYGQYGLGSSLLGGLVLSTVPFLTACQPFYVAECRHNIRLNPDIFGAAVRTV